MRKSINWNNTLKSAEKETKNKQTNKQNKTKQKQNKKQNKTKQTNKKPTETSCKS